MKIFKNILKLVAMVSLLVLAITNNPIAAIFLLVAASMHLGVLITERV